jgi:hypothetical protein
LTMETIQELSTIRMKQKKGVKSLAIIGLTKWRYVREAAILISTKRAYKYTA